MIDHSASQIQMTNDTFIDIEKRILRRFMLLAEHEDQYWVQALNGIYQLELLTFDKSALRNI